MKTLKYSIIPIITILLTYGCDKEDFLTKYPSNSMVVEEYYQNDSQAMRALTAAYKPLTRPGLYGSGFFISYGACGDDVESIELPFVNFSYTMDNGQILGIWDMCYQGIQRSNLVLTKLPEAKPGQISNNIMKMAIGQAYFLRALYYWHLVTIFGEVPLLTEYLENYNDYDGHKKPVTQIWAQIESDLLKAESILPRSWDPANVGRATWGAAKGLLGKSYLYQNKYDEAAEEFDSIINKADNLYGLMDDPNEIFNTAFENNKESLFEVQFATIGGISWGSEDNPSWGNAGMRVVFIAPQQSPYTGWENYFPSASLGRSYESGDLRKSAFIYSNGDLITPVDTFVGGRPNKTTTGYGVKKGMLSTYAPWGSQGYGDNWILLRYADILLMHAEALSNQGNDAEAAIYVNKVRQRAFGTKYTDADYGVEKLMNDSSWTMMKAIKHERLVELAFEGHRFPDLVRWGDAVNKLNTRGYQSKHSYFPIPPQEVDRSGGQLKQNPDWN